MTIRAIPCALAAAALALSGCNERESGPIGVSVIGAAPRLVNPNLEPLDPPSAFLTEAVAQGLVRFDSAGEIEPALAQSWVVSDDGLRYTFRIRRASWSGGGRVTASAVVARLRASFSRASRNPLKPVLGAIEDVVAMTDEVLEISLRGARPNFLQLLAQPEMAIVQASRGTGPYVVAGTEAGWTRLMPLRNDEQEAADAAPDILLRGERGALGIARFADRSVDLVTGGTAGDLPIARASDPPRDALVFDPVSGLFGLVFATRDGPLADPEIRRAMAMAIDREGLAAALAVPGMAARTTLVPAGVQDLPRPLQPDWSQSPLPARRDLAARAVAERVSEARISVRVAMPEGPGYRLVFAHLRRDWRFIGIDAEQVAMGAPADLRFVDAVAPANLASWYLRRFSCDASAICDAAADEALRAARLAAKPGERQAQLAIADRILTGLTPFIPLSAPVRWSLVSRRLSGFRPNPFARHSAAELIAERP